MKKSSNSISPLLEKPFKVPKFSAVDTQNKPITEGQLKNNWHILYFYPKDMTSGCTTEAKDFEAALQKFNSLNCKIVGVSKDSCQRHAKFVQKEDISFNLISDSESNLCELLDVWKEKSLYGRKYMGIERTTFIVNPEGYIVARFSKVKVNGHVEDVLKTLSQLANLQ